MDEGDGGAKTKRKAVYESDPVVAKNKDLFGFGCVAKVSGVQGRRQGELALVVEGLNRFRIEKILQERPYFEGMIEVVEDEGMWSFYNICQSIRGIWEDHRMHNGMKLE